MLCPYCGSPMHHGELALDLGAWNSALLWMPDRPPPGGIWAEIKTHFSRRVKRRIIDPGFLRRGRRFANYCGSCEAVTIDPATPEAIVIQRQWPPNKTTSNQTPTDHPRPTP
jgi:hypothetical protein